jgi:hypothetical protein
MPLSVPNGLEAATSLREKILSRQELNDVTSEIRMHTEEIFKQELEEI